MPEGARWKRETAKPAPVKPCGWGAGFGSGVWVRAEVGVGVVLGCVRSGVLADLGHRVVDALVVVDADVHARGADEAAGEDGALATAGGALHGVVRDPGERVVELTVLLVLAREVHRGLRLRVDDRGGVDLEREGVVDEVDHDELGEVRWLDVGLEDVLDHHVEAHDDVLRGEFVQNFKPRLGVQEGVGEDVRVQVLEVLEGHQRVHVVVGHVLPRGGRVGVRAGASGVKIGIHREAVFTEGCMCWCE